MVKKSTSALKVDFTGVEAGGGFNIPDGQYVLAVTGVTQKKGAESGNPYLSWEFKVDSGKYKNRKIWDNTSLQPQALWKLRGLLECMGLDVEDGEFEIDLGDLEGELVGAEIVNEKYEGKDKPKVANYMPAEDVDDGDTGGDEGNGEEEPEEEAPPPSTKKGSTKAASTAGKTTISPSKAKKEEEEPPEEEQDGDETEAETEPEPTKVSSRKKKTVAPSFEVGDAVTFEDEGETYKGKVHSVGDETIEVKVGKDIWELGKDEVTAA
jgi:hypothetical protein